MSAQQVERQRSFGYNDIVAPASGGWPVVATLAWVGMLVQIPLLSRLAMLESGKVKSLRDLAAREGIDNSYVSRMVNLTTLAPHIVAAILDDVLPNYITQFDLACRRGSVIRC